MEPEGSLPHSQVPATCLYPQPARSSPYPKISYCKLVFSFPSHLPYLSPTRALIAKFEFFPWSLYWYPLKTKNDLPIFLETSEISPAMINLLTRTPTNCLTFQHQTANDGLTNACKKYEHKRPQHILLLSAHQQQQCFFFLDFSTSIMYIHFHFTFAIE